MNREYREKAFVRFVETYAPKWEKIYAAALAATIAAARKDGLRELASCFSSVCQRAFDMQQNDAFGAVSAIRFSFLHSSLLSGCCGSYRIDVCDDAWLLQERECAVRWNADFAFKPFFSVLADIKQEARKTIPYIREIETDAFALYWANDRPRKIADATIEMQTPAFAEFVAYRRLQKTDNCRFLLGEYRDDSHVIYEQK
jgi:hypothetical protein